LLDGFEHERAYARGSKNGGVVSFHARGQQQESDLGQGGVGLDQLGKADSIHVRHLQIQDRKWIRLSVGRGSSQDLDCFRAVFRGRRAHPKERGLLGEEISGRFMIIHHQHPEPGEIWWCSGWRGAGVGLLLEVGGKPKRRTFALDTLDADLTAHHFHDVFGNCETKACAAISAGG
jgi:hypothetical protein